MNIVSFRLRQGFGGPPQHLRRLVAIIAIEIVTVPAYLKNGPSEK